MSLELALGVATFVGLRLIRAPYGRYARGGWGPTIPARLGWLLMESPAALVFAIVYVLGDHRADPVPLVLLAGWELHYLYRAFVYPWRLRGGTRMPVSVASMAVVFNLLNASINARWVSQAGRYPLGWLADPRFLAGAVLFGVGLALNLSADRTLRRLRGPGESGYKVPRGGAYRWVSCPNYLGEIVEWSGWALATWALPGVAFAVYTAANLVPRALDHHDWYRQRFVDYPPTRRALIPYVL
ncbi:3-oxo-5-alpha-steroid 4-dehydrogenase [Rugosimonospora acidiphila]|uniref:3-oxo-5-alpha-steroid 4-dehydrogenase n=1 Tax=Rugosimonospora acidiphila TaxID=556531 RepID=A0ABP9STV8_9ACTN